MLTLAMNGRAKMNKAEFAEYEKFLQKEIKMHEYIMSKHSKDSYTHGVHNGHVGGLEKARIRFDKLFRKDWNTSKIVVEKFADILKGKL